MRILQLIQKPQMRGAETFALQLADHLVSRGHRVIVASLFAGDRTIHTRATLIHLNRPSSYRIVDVGGYRELSKIIREHDIDVVQANAGDTLKYAVLSRSLFGWKAKIVFRNASTVSQYIKGGIVKLFNHWLYRQTDHIISVAEFTKQDLVNLFPGVKAKIDVIPIGVEFDASCYSADKFYDIIHVGGFTFEKNHQGLIAIFAEIVKAVPQARLLLVGDGPLRTRIEKLVRKNNIETRVTFTGSVSNVLDYIRASRVLVLPSLLEGLPAVILEAFMCKVPVVAYDTGGIKEVLNDQTGNLVGKNKDADFVSAVIGNLQNPSAERTERAYDLTRNSFDNHHIAARFEKVYAKLIGEANP